MVAPHFLHDLSGQSLCPGVTWEGERESNRESVAFSTKVSVFPISFLFVSVGIAVISKVLSKLPVVTPMGSFLLKIFERILNYPNSIGFCLFQHLYSN